jgi:hypothetical protein
MLSGMIRMIASFPFMNGYLFGRPWSGSEVPWRFIYPYPKEISLLSVKSIDKVSKKALYIELESKKGKPKKDQEKTSKMKLKKIIATTKKRRDPNKHCKHCDANGNMYEKCWKLHLELCQMRHNSK